MHFPSYDQKLFYNFLSGIESPFPVIYDAVSEQVLLLILKARELNENPIFSKWFAEQHKVLTKLRSQSEKIDKIFEDKSFLASMYKNEKDDLRDALIFMSGLYEGFDDGIVSLKTWGNRNRESMNQKGRLTERQRNKSIQEFIDNEVFDILTGVGVSCSAIPPHERKGYCHQDLSIAHSCSTEILSRLSDFHKIDSLQVLAHSIFNLIRDLNNTGQDIPDWLSKFNEAYYQPYMRDETKSDACCEAFMKLIRDEGRDKFVKRIVEQCEDNHASHLLNCFVYIYALTINCWLYNLLMYFKNPQSIPFTWKFKTVSNDTNLVSENDLKKMTFKWDSDVCLISIERNNLLKLIQTHTLFDATEFLANCLFQIYSEPAQQMQKNDGEIPSILEKETIEYDSNSYIFPKTSSSKTVNILKFFERWHENNKILLINHKNTRTEQVSVEVRLAGLKCYDLKLGIPNGNGMKVKDGVYNLVRNDKNLRFENSISDVSLQRYHSQIKKIIKRINELLDDQKDNNSKYPFSGAFNAIKPLWGKN